MRYAGRLGRHNRFTLTVAGAVACAELALLSSYLLTHGSWPTADALVLALVPVALIVGRPHWFLLDWGVLLGLWLAWQALAGIVDPSSLGNVNITGPIGTERRMFDGEVPTLALQRAFFRLDRLAWYDWLATYVHAAHFAVPIALGFILWLKSRALFWRLSLTILVTSYAGLMFYWRYPAAPPWLASDLGYFAPRSVWRILGATTLRFPATAPIGWVWQHFSPNDVAAIPSLHAALALLVALTAWQVFPRWAPLALLYVLIMDVSLVYLGEHYVLDVLVGSGVAAGSFALVWPAGAALSRWWAGAFPQPAARSCPRMRELSPPEASVPWWWEAARAVMLPGLPLAALLWLLWGPLDLRPVGPRGPWLFKGPLAPPPCIEEPGELLGGAEAALAPAGAPAALFVEDLTRGACYVADPSGIVPLTDGRDVWLAALERAVTWDPPGELGPLAEGVTVSRRTGRPAEVLGDPAAAGGHVYGVVVLVRGEADADSLASLLTAAAERALPELVQREHG